MGIPAPGSVATTSAAKQRDSGEAFRTARLVAMIAAVVSGALTATHWYGASTFNEVVERITLSQSLWAAHSALGSLIVAGGALVAGTSASSLFRVPNDKPNLPPIVLGFAVVAAIAMLVCSIIGLALTPSFGEVHFHDSVWGVLTLLLAIIALGGTAVMFSAGREQSAEVLAPSVAAPSLVTIPEAHGAAVTDNASNEAAPSSAQQSRRDSDDDLLKRCPECAEWVKDAANVCRYCGFRFASAEPISNR